MASLDRICSKELSQILMTLVELWNGTVHERFFLPSFMLWWYSQTIGPPTFAREAFGRYSCNLLPKSTLDLKHLCRLHA